MARPPGAADVPFGVARPLKTSELVARRIVSDIVAAGLGVGASLPSEAKMMAQYDVSRESLREALRLLEVPGFIRLKRGPGGGPVVGGVEPAALGRMATTFFEMAGATYDELYAAWAAAEVLLAERAARHPDAARRAEVMAPYLPDGIHDEHSPVSAQADLHAALASLVENRVLSISMQTFGHIITHHAVVAGDPGSGKGAVYRDHVVIATAVRRGHPKRAAEAMAVHVQRVIDHLRSQPETAGDRVITWI